MEHRAWKSVKKQSQMEMTIKTEMEAAATFTAYIDHKINLNHLKQETGLVQSVKSEPVLLVKEDILEDSGEDGNDQQCVQGALTPAGTGSLNEACSTSLSDRLNVKDELIDMDIGPTVLQHMDIHYIINKTMSVVTEEKPIVDDCNEAMPCSGVKKESVEDKLRGSFTSQNTTINERRPCSVLPNLQLAVLMDKLVTICRVHLTRLDTFQCDLCDLVYTEKHRLLLHLESMHESCPQTSAFVKFHQSKKRRAAANNSIPGKYCGQKVTDDNFETHLTFCGGQKDRWRKHLTTSSNSFKCDMTISKPHLLDVHNKVHQRNCRKISTMTSSVVTASSNQRRDETPKTKQKSDFHVKEIFSKKHLIQHTGEKPYRCDTCDARSSCGTTLINHMRVHTCEKPYRCGTCDKRFTQNSHLIRHMRVHTGEKPYRCNTCDVRFSCNTTLINHMRIHTGEKPYRCSTCDKRFSQNSNLIRHMRVHTGEKPFRCDTCDASFSYNTLLINHMRIHTGEKLVNYLCDTCDARFAHKSHLIEHRRLHTGQKPYRCDTCDSRFARKRHLVLHMRVHTGEKPYRCDICDARFALKNTLVVHMRVHTRDKPYRCDACDTRFSQKSNLSHHNKVHTSVKPYRCNTCDA